VADQEIPSRPASDRAIRPATRADMCQPARMFAHGEALVVQIEAPRSSGESWARLGEAARGKTAKNQLAKQVKHDLGPRYSLDHIDCINKTLKIYIYSAPLDGARQRSFLSRQSSLIWSLSTDTTRLSESSSEWVLRADATAEEMRRWARRQLCSAPASRRCWCRWAKCQIVAQGAELDVEVTSEWKPGSGVELTLRTDGSAEAEIRSEISVLQRRHVQTRDRLPATLFAAGTLTAAAILLWTLPLVFGGRSDKWTIAVLFTLYAAITWMMAAGFLAAARRLRQELQSKESSLDLVGLLNYDEQRAFKLFQIDTLEIRRYYEQALRQRRFIFYVGIVCILAGFASVFAAFRLISSASQAQLSEKIVIASLGAVGGILANFVGLIFLRMFSTVVQSMVDFHKRLVATHHVVFANVLVAKIQDAKTRDETLSTIAQELSRRTATDGIDCKCAQPSGVQS
jgi:hypothetical protein